MKYTCPVCGYPELEEIPRAKGRGGSYEICPSCNFEFGFTDEDEGYTYEAWRERWIKLGMPWDVAEAEDRPPGWDPQKQLDDFLRSQGGA